MTVRTVDTSIVLNTVKPHSFWCAFEHHVQLEADKPPQIIYVGISKLTDVYKLAECRVNSEWSRMFRGGGHVMVRIIAIGEDRTETLKYAMRHMKALDPIPVCNAKGVSTRGLTRRVKCLNDGEVFASQKQAAEAYGLYPSSLSRHLQGATHVVNGLMFEYVDRAER